mmetsp:Transcript_5741/g.17102  ORF Transcript_5741/g.17102 Transcript_5741/m.17102 type:complete len:323 (-) Transcript_5741:284-1252(-)
MAAKKLAKRPVRRRPRRLMSELREHLSAFIIVLVLGIAGVLLLRYGAGRKKTRGHVHGYSVVATIPHDRDAFTQGLLFWNDCILESTGNYGKSELKKINATSGETILTTKLDNTDFGEGISLDANKDVLVLTWQSGKGYIFDVNTFQKKSEWAFEGDGWGIASNSRRDEIYLSDGTSTIRVLDAKSLSEKRRVSVHDRGRHIYLLNELEYVNGELWANVFDTYLIARIDPSTGAVKSWIDCRGILPRGYAGTVDVMNGIAYDERTGNLFLTGKFWPYIYQIQVSNHVVARDVADQKPLFFDRYMLGRYQEGLQLKVDFTGLP